MPPSRVDGGTFQLAKHPLVVDAVEMVSLDPAAELGRPPFTPEHSSGGSRDGWQRADSRPVGVSDRDYMRDLPGYRETFRNDPIPRPAVSSSALPYVLVVIAAVAVVNLVLAHVTVDGRHWTFLPF